MKKQKIIVGALASVMAASSLCSNKKKTTQKVAFLLDRNNKSSCFNPQPISLRRLMLGKTRRCLPLGSRGYRFLSAHYCRYVNSTIHLTTCISFRG